MWFHPLARFRAGPFIMRALRKVFFATRRGSLPVEVWLVALFTLIGAWIRLEGLGQPGLWWDEVISLDKALLPLRELWPTLAAWGTGDAGIELFPPLYHFLLHGALALCRSDAALRLVGVAFGVASIPAMFALGRELFGRPAGLIASFLLATSTYHIHYSREVRPYSLFILLSLVALTALHAAVVRGKARAWPVYAASMAAMLYTSYMASTALAAHGLFTLLALAPDMLRPGPQRRRALGVLVRACAAWLAALAVYLPWLPNQLVTLEALRDTPRTAHLAWSFFATAANEFAGFAYTGPLPVGAAFALLSLAGAWAAWQRRLGRQLALLALWALVPVAAMIAAKTGIDATSRYIISAYLAGILLTALALCALGQRVLRPIPLPDFAREGAVLTLALMAASLCAWPSLASREAYLRREPSQYKLAMAWLDRHAGEADRLLFSSGRGLKLLARWYLDDAFHDLSSYSPRGYKRAFALVPQGRTRGFEGRPPLFSTREVDIHALGLASAAPVTLAPDPNGQAVHRIDLSGPDFYRDCLRAENLTPDFGGKALSLFDARRPGQAEFAFVAPTGMTLDQARIQATFSAVFKANIACDATVTLSYSLDGATFLPLATVRASDFFVQGRQPSGHHALTRAFDLPAQLRGARELYVRVDYGPVTRYGAVELSDLRLAAHLEGTPPSPEQLAARIMETVARNNALAPWTPGLVLAGKGRLVAFAHPGALPLPNVGSPRDLERFLRAHPGLSPVLTVPLADGRPAYSLFDPGLDRPFADLKPCPSTAVALDDDLARHIRAARIQGLLRRPAFFLDGASVRLPVTADLPAELDINFGQQAKLVLLPLFDLSGARQVLPLGRNLKRPGDEDCLTCAGPGPCSLTLTVRSDWPVTAVRLEYYPRVVADLAGNNQVSARLSADGGPFLTLDRYRPAPTGRWEGLKSRRAAVRTLPHPARTVAVRFDLSGQDAQLWSAPDARLRLELTLDAQKAAPPHTDEPLPRLNADHPLAVELLADPIRFPDALLPKR